MDLNSITKYSKQLTRSFNRNSPTILTGLGVAGLISTVILAIKATPKAMEILEYEKRFRVEEDQGIRASDAFEYHDAISNTKLDAIDVFELTWKCYIPTTIMGTVTIACMIGSNHINLRRNAALASLFSITETALKEYKEKVVEKIGEKKEELIRGEIAQDAIDRHPPDQRTIVITPGTTMFYDSLSDRYFFSDPQDILKAQNLFNKRLLNEMSLSLNEFYIDIGLDPIQLGSNMGWTVEKGMMDLYLGSAKITKEGKPCVVLVHSNQPTSIW